MGEDITAAPDVYDGSHDPEGAASRGRSLGVQAPGQERSNRRPGKFGKELSNGVRLFHLFHQIIVPLARHLKMGGGAQHHGLDQIVIEVNVGAGLQEFIQGRAG